MVYDLYTGTGTIALFLAQKAKKVIGVESVPEAIADANINAEVNNIDNAELTILKKRATQISAEGEKASDVIKKVIDETERSSSLYPTVKEINKEFSIVQKKAILQNLWELVAADGVINHYEENLFFSDADRWNVVFGCRR